MSLFFFQVIARINKNGQRVAPVLDVHGAETQQQFVLETIDPSTSLTFVSYNILADALSGNEAGFSSENEDGVENRAGKILKKIFPREDKEEQDNNNNNNENDRRPSRRDLRPRVRPLLRFLNRDAKERVFWHLSRRYGHRAKCFPVERWSGYILKGKTVAGRDARLDDGETKEQDAKVLFARLIMKKSLTRQEVVVINAHLESGQSPDKVVTRVNQAKEMCARLNAFCVAQCSNINTVQIVVCGDFNATPEEPCMEHLRGRGLKSAYEDLETSNSSKNGEQEQQQLEGEEPFFTTFKTRLGFFKNGTSKRVSDYIMYSAHRGAKIVSRVEPQQNGFGEGVVGLPSKTQPSDHLCLRSRLSFEHPIVATPTSNGGAQAK